MQSVHITRQRLPSRKEPLRSVSNTLCIFTVSSVLLLLPIKPHEGRAAVTLRSSPTGSPQSALQVWICVSRRKLSCPAAPQTTGSQMGCGDLAVDHTMQGRPSFPQDTETCHSSPPAAFPPFSPSPVLPSWPLGIRLFHASLL